MRIYSLTYKVDLKLRFFIRLLKKYRKIYDKNENICIRYEYEIKYQNKDA